MKMSELKEIIAYILKEYPYKEELSNARLTKLIYLADWHQSLQDGKQISDIAWYFDNYGPYVKDVIEEAEKEKSLFRIRKSSNLYGSEKRILELNDKKYEPSISEKAKISLNHAIKETQNLGWSRFIKLIYSTYPIISSERYSDLDLIKKAKEYQGKR